MYVKFEVVRVKWPLLLTWEFTHIGYHSEIYGPTNTIYVRVNVRCKYKFPIPSQIVIFTMLTREMIHSYC